MRSILSVLLLASLIACASNKPFGPLVQAKEHVAAAKAAKADIYFATEYTAAAERLPTIEKLVVNFDYKTANNLSQESCALADLSLARTQVHLSNTALEQAERDLELLKESMLVQDPVPLAGRAKSAPAPKVSAAPVQP